MISKELFLAFENLDKLQSGISDELKNNIKNNLLPQSLLFSGRPGSGRLTGALDLAFYLTGDNRDLLRTQSIIYFPHRNLLSRLDAGVKLFSRQRNRESKLFLIETIRLINMQYNSVLSSSFSSSSSSLFDTAEKADVFLSEIEDRDDFTDKDIKTLLSLKLSGNPKYVYSGHSSPSPATIDQLRCIKEWAGSSFGKKVVIIEDIEAATEGAKNSILKMLEEPEEHLTIILVSKESTRIMETILSRVRKFNFPPLGGDNVSSLIEKRFNIRGDFSSFDSFYFYSSHDEESIIRLRNEVSSFLSLIVSSSNITPEKEDELDNLLETTGAYKYFRESLLEEVERRLRTGELAFLKARRILSILQKWNESVEVYNMNEKTGLDYIIREAALVK